MIESMGSAPVNNINSTIKSKNISFSMMSALIGPQKEDDDKEDDSSPDENERDDSKEINQALEDHRMDESDMRPYLIDENQVLGRDDEGGNEEIIPRMEDEEDEDMGSDGDLSGGMNAFGIGGMGFQRQMAYLSSPTI
jgi:hypothetical protein